MVRLKYMRQFPVLLLKSRLKWCVKSLGVVQPWGRSDRPGANHNARLSPGRHNEQVFRRMR